MQSAVRVSSSEPLKIVTKPVPKAPSKGVLIRTVCSGICHTDLHVYEDFRDVKNKLNRDLADPNYRFDEVVLGHEISGIVEDIGSEVDQATCGFAKGDSVLVYPWLGCKMCPYCLAKQPNLCTNVKKVLATSEVGQGGGGNAGGFQTHVPLNDSRFVFKFDNNRLLHEVACMLPCSVSTTYGALKAAKATVESLTNVFSSVNVAVFGCGGLGLWCMAMAKTVLGKNINIVGIDISEEKLELAKDAGADAVFLSSPGATSEGTALEIQQKYQAPFAAAFDFVGIESTFHTGFNLIAQGGAMFSLGLYGSNVQMHLPSLILSTKTLRGIRVASIGDFLETINLFETHNVHVPPHEFISLANINDAMQRLRQGTVRGRAIIKFD